MIPSAVVLATIAVVIVAFLRPSRIVAVAAAVPGGSRK